MHFSAASLDPQSQALILAASGTFPVWVAQGQACSPTEPHILPPRDPRALWGEPFGTVGGWVSQEGGGEREPFPAQSQNQEPEVRDMSRQGSRPQFLTLGSSPTQGCSPVWPGGERFTGSEIWLVLVSLVAAPSQTHTLPKFLHPRSGLSLSCSPHFLRVVRGQWAGVDHLHGALKRLSACPCPCHVSPLL